MKELINEIKEREYTKLELALIGVCLLFGGIIIGIIASPKGERNYGSYNGSFNGYNEELLDDDFED